MQKNVVARLQDDPQWCCLLVFTSFVVPLTLFQGWSIWPTAHSRNDGKPLLRLDYTRLWLPFCTLNLSFQGWTDTFIPNSKTFFFLYGFFQPLLVDILAFEHFSHPQVNARITLIPSHWLKGREASLPPLALICRWGNAGWSLVLIWERPVTPNPMTLWCGEMVSKDGCH